MKPEKFIAQIIKIENLSGDIKNYTIKVPENFQFASGQYISIMMEKDNKKIRRPYSIASSPELKGKIELCIKIIQRGLLTPEINKLKKGDKIEVLGPLGFFKIEESSTDKNLVFISNGTGIGPFRSMIKTLIKNKHNKNITLITGYQNTSLYHREFLKLEKENSNFKFLPSLTKPEKNWKGLKGRVQEHLESFLKENKSQIKDTDFYICGLKEMINSVKNILIKKEIPMNSIYSEKYD